MSNFTSKTNNNNADSANNGTTTAASTSNSTSTGRYIPPAMRNRTSNSVDTINNTSTNSNNSYRNFGSSGGGRTSSANTNTWNNNRRPYNNNSSNSSSSGGTSTLNAANLAQRNAAYQPPRKSSHHHNGHDDNDDDDDDLETTSVMSRINFTDNLRRSYHGIQRMNQRDISNEQVSRVIKHGIRLTNTTTGSGSGSDSGSSGIHTTFLYHEYIVILGSREAERLQGLEERDIAGHVQVDNNTSDAPPPPTTTSSSTTSTGHTLVTVFRDTNILNSGITGEEFWLWRKLMLCICSKDDHNKRVMQRGAASTNTNATTTATTGEGAIGEIEHPSYQIEHPTEEFTKLFGLIRTRYESSSSSLSTTTTRGGREEREGDRFTKLLNWTIGGDRREKYYGITRQRTLLTVAAIRGYGSIVKLLLDYGANPLITTRWSSSHIGSTLIQLLRSAYQMPWISSIVKEDMMMLIVTHPMICDNKKMLLEVLQEKSDGLPLLHHVLFKGVNRLLAYMLQSRYYCENTPNLLNMTNKYHETTLTLAMNRGIDLNLFLLPEYAIEKMSSLPALGIQEVPLGYTILPCSMFAGAVTTPIDKMTFRMACLSNTKVTEERFVGGDVNGLTLQRNDDKALEFLLDQPNDIYGAPMTLGPKGLVRWSILPSKEEEERMSLLISGYDGTHESRYLQRTSVRHYDFMLKLSFAVSAYNNVAFDFAWSFYVLPLSIANAASASAAGEEVDHQVAIMKRFYEEKQPIDVIIGNSYKKTSTGVFVVIDERRGSYLKIQECSAAEAAVFRLYPTW